MRCLDGGESCGVTLAAHGNAEKEILDNQMCSDPDGTVVARQFCRAFLGTLDMTLGLEWKSPRDLLGGTQE